MSRKGWRLTLVAAVVALVGFLAWRFPEALSAQGDWVRVFTLVALLALVSGGVVAGYSYRAELGDVGERVLGNLLPHRGTEVEGGAVVFRAGSDGHFRIEALVDGAPVRFLVDTGASDVVLSPADARRLGFALEDLAFTRRYATANGVVRGAPVRLGEVVVGPIRLTGVAASVNESPMDGSLLGLSFLGRLGSYEVRGGALTLRQ